jgi:hypothetical protein
MINYLLFIAVKILAVHIASILPSFVLGLVRFRFNREPFPANKI